jgi:hypothetical protein
MAFYHRLSIPYQKFLGTEVYWIWGVLEYLYIHDEVFQGWDPNLNE